MTVLSAVMSASILMFAIVGYQSGWSHGQGIATFLVLANFFLIFFVSRLERIKSRSALGTAVIKNIPQLFFFAFILSYGFRSKAPENWWWVSYDWPTLIICAALTLAFSVISWYCQRIAAPEGAAIEPWPKEASIALAALGVAAAGICVTSHWVQVPTIIRTIACLIAVVGLIISFDGVRGLKVGGWESLITLGGMFVLLFFFSGTIEKWWLYFGLLSGLATFSTNVRAIIRLQNPPPNAPAAEGAVQS